MKKVLSIFALILIGCMAVWHVVYYWIPTFPTYSEQKKYAKELYGKTDETGQIAIFMPTATAGKIVYYLFYRPATKKTLKANLLMLEKYPGDAKEDIDILGWTGDSYYRLQKYNNALEMYKRQLEVFKKKYFNKINYPEKEGLTPLQAKTEEYRYIVNVHRTIAACYNATKQYEKGLNEYEKILQLLPETKDLEKWDRESIFKDTFVSMGKLYKVILKDYQNALQIYERVKTEFSDSVFFISQADIYIGDVYLAMGDVKKAKEIYKAVVDKYKYPGSTANYDVAEGRLRDLQEGNLIVATDGLNYEIKDGKVIARLTGSKEIISVSEITK